VRRGIPSFRSIQVDRILGLRTRTFDWIHSDNHQTTLGLQKGSICVFYFQSNIVVNVAQILRLIHDIHKSGHTFPRGWVDHSNLFLNQLRHALAPGFACLQLLRVGLACRRKFFRQSLR
jgi:hypothetical protein